jgi:hypothetical protein
MIDLDIGKFALGSVIGEAWPQLVRRRRQLEERL